MNTRAFILAAAFAATACGAPQADPETSAEASSEPAQPERYSGDALVLDWSDLIPEGEDPRPVPQLAELPGFASPFSADGDFSDPDRIGREHDPDNEGGTLADAQTGTFNTIDRWAGERVRVPGFIVPLDYEDGATTRFLLVPYFGACIHAPPPPPNQTLYAEIDDPLRVERLSRAVWIEGVLETGRFDSVMGDAAYSMRVEDWEPYEGRFRR